MTGGEPQAVARGVTSATHPVAAIGSAGADPSAVAPYMLGQMQRNIATAGYVIADTSGPSAILSLPGCVIASPSYKTYPGNLVPVSEDYVYNWTRDAALTVAEIQFSSPALLPLQAATQTLTDYVQFAHACQAANAADVGHGKYTVNAGYPGWSSQSDGPALRVLTILQGYGLLDTPTRAIAQQVIAADVPCLLGPSPIAPPGDTTPWYQTTTFNHWEDTEAKSLFARAVQLRCFDQLTSNAHQIPVAGEVASAISWLQQEIPAHWDSTHNWYVSLLPPVTRHSDQPPTVAYDPAIDAIMACIYGDGIPPDDPKLLSTAAAIRDHWTTGAAAYPINAADPTGLGPLIGRYADDGYDGDDTGIASGHPWAVCTCNFAQLYYLLAREIAAGTPVPTDPLAGGFFAQIGVTNPAGSSPTEVIDALRTAGDSMLNAVIYHSDHLSLSEQFDQSTGFEKSVVDLTWSYAAFLSALRTRP